jgi:hypothetical protein
VGKPRGIPDTINPRKIGKLASTLEVIIKQNKSNLKKALTP